MAWRMPPNWNVSKEHIPVDWDWFVQLASPEMVGQEVGHYQITATLNEATNVNGQSYRAIDKTTSSAATVRVLSYWLVDSPEATEAQELFQREARSASALNHSNIATVYETWIYEGRAHLAMEVLEGNILRERLKAGRVSREEFFHLAIQLASAIAAAHERGILLRWCLNPASVFVTSAGDAKILDCGVERLRYADWDLERPDAHYWCRYMAPEYACNETHHDTRTDLYLLGQVLYELAVCRLPFSGALACLEHRPAPLAEAVDLPSRAKELILKLLEKNPQDRCQSALEVCDALKRAEACS